jgi:hypothetical protein
VRMATALKEASVMLSLAVEGQISYMIFLITLQNAGQPALRSVLLTINANAIVAAVAAVAAARNDEGRRGDDEGESGK